MSPNDYVGAIMEICQSKRGNFINMEYLDETRVISSMRFHYPKSFMISSTN